MSRSYKKFCVFKEENSKYGKRQASKAVRRTTGIKNGGLYKKYYCSWNICDFRIYIHEKYISKKEFINKWHNDENFYFYHYDYENWKEAYRIYKRICINK